MGALGVTVRGWAIALLAATASGCTDGDATAGVEGRAPSSDIVPLEDTTLAHESLRRAFIQARQNEAARDARYMVSASKDVGATLRAFNPAQGLLVQFEGGAARLTSADHAWQLDLIARGLRCGSDYRLFEPVTPRSSGANRVSYDRSVNGVPLEEWYVNGPLGLEQGFTLGRSPCPEQEEHVTVELAVRGLTPVLQARQDATGERREVIRLTEDTGLAVANLADWFAYDATGRALPLRVEVTDQRVGLAVSVQGATWPVIIDPMLSAEQTKLVSSDSTAGVSRNVGYSVALAGDTALVGSRPSSPGQNGAAYVYVRSGASWTEQKKLVASDGASDDRFGEAVALSGTTALVSAPGHDPSGAAYVFVGSGANWTEQKKLVPSQAGNGFRESVALSGETAVISGASAAYVFVRSGTSWTEQAQLTPANAGTLGPVALSGDTALVGAPIADSSNGAAYVFVRSGTTWSQPKKLTSSAPVNPNNRFGTAVALAGDTALVGSESVDSYRGAAYVFVRSAGVWSEQARLAASDGTAGDRFAGAVALLGDVALLGAWNDDSQGSAYLFVRSGATWTERRRLTASDAAAGDSFGKSVALSGETALVGAPSDDTYKGAAYPYVFGFANGDACSKHSECFSKHCVEGVCCDTACSGTCTTCLAARKASGQDGTCGNTKVSTDPRNHCSAEAATTCGLDGFCDGAGACARHAAGTECAPASCPTATSQNLADTCNGTGNCLVTATQACQTGYACVSGACKTSCVGSQDCDTASGYACVETACVRSPDGASCQSSNQCMNGACVDGVCCESACKGQCEACTLELTGMPDGVCAPIPADQDPEEECPQDQAYPTSCLSDGLCNGERACRAYAMVGTACGETSCEDGQVSGEICNGGGKCGNDSAKCGVYACDGDACGSSCEDDAQCGAGAYCLPGGSCAEKLRDGSPCTEARECEHDVCVDGVCCESECAAQCASCAEPNREGECVAVSGAPRGDREPCAGDPEVCGGQCGGVDVLECEYPASTRICARSCTDGRETLSSCDGTGECVAGKASGCDGYACGEDSCLTECAEDSDCESGFGCLARECVPKTAQCVGTDRSRNSQNEETACAPFLCDESSGACLKTCGSSGDCIDGFVCNGSNSKCEQASGAVPDDGGCGCRAAGQPSPGSRPHGVGWLALGLVWLVRRRAPSSRAGATPRGPGR